MGKAERARAAREYMSGALARKRQLEGGEGVEFDRGSLKVGGTKVVHRATGEGLTDGKRNNGGAVRTDGNDGPGELQEHVNRVTSVRNRI